MSEDTEKSLEEIVRDAYQADQEAQEEEQEEKAADESTVDDSTKEPEESKESPATEPEPKKELAKVEAKRELVKSEPAKEDKTKEPEDDGNWGEDKAPQSWTPKSRERWNEIPADLRKEIVRREEAGVQGIRQLNERYAPAAQVFDGLSSYIGEAIHHGVNPIEHISSVMNTERILRLGDNKQKFNEILRIADQFGVPLRDIINKSIGEEFIKAPTQQQYAVPPELQQRLSQLENAYATNQQDSSNARVAEFSKGKEFFEDVRILMADLMDAGRAETLEDAYDQACWATPSVREVLISRQGKDKKDEELKGRQKAANKVSTSSNKAVEVPEVDNEDSIESFVRKQVIASMSGRT